MKQVYFLAALFGFLAASTVFADAPHTQNYIDKDAVYSAYLNKQIRKKNIGYDFDYENAITRDFTYSLESPTLECLTAPKNRKAKISDFKSVASEKECKEWGRSLRRNAVVKLTERRQSLHKYKETIKNNLIAEGKHEEFEKTQQEYRDLSDCEHAQAQSFNIAFKKTNSIYKIESAHKDDPRTLYGEGVQIIILDGSAYHNTNSDLGLTYNLGVEMRDKIYIKAIFENGKCYITSSDAIAKAFDDVARMEEQLDQEKAKDSAKPAKNVKRASRRK